MYMDTHILSEFENDSNTVCFVTCAKILKILDSYGYQSQYSIKYNNVFSMIGVTIRSLFQDKNSGFLLVSNFGHCYLIEVDSAKQSIRFYQSYGGRFSLSQWMDTEKELKPAITDRMSSADYSYDIDQADLARAKYGGSLGISGPLLDEFIDQLSSIGDSDNVEDLQNNYVKVFGVKFPIDKSTNKPVGGEKNRTKGNITFLTLTI